MNSTIHIGDTIFKSDDLQVKGELTQYDNEVYYKISNVNHMRPFFISLVSNSNHWMFISSNGGLSAGRKNADKSLFPYYTDDKITESYESTGSKTIVKVIKTDKQFLWEPFSDKYEGAYQITRNLYKNKWGNKIVFEEINQDLQLVFSYQWSTSENYGFVRKSTIKNLSNTTQKVSILDGIQNILPYGVSADLQGIRSNLVDAYKKCELEKDAGIGIYALSSVIVDKAEPSEALKSNIVWSFNTKNPTYLVSSTQLDAFRKGQKVTEEVDVKAEKGAYFTIQTIDLQSNTSDDWYVVANVNQTVVDVAAISKLIQTEKNLSSLILEDVKAGTKNLLELVSASDGLQQGKSALRNTRHFANTLFNIMRGGIFDNNYSIEKDDFIKYLKNANKNLVSNFGDVLKKLPSTFDVNYLKNITDNQQDTDFKRLCIEYLPLKFSRRHGDPSRPWNKFSINTKSEVDGSKILDYEGNWRDIFQNWEALAHSYPAFIEGMIYKFLNASTFDGYNPYRVTKDGFDWEVIEEHDPWSYIGYWGDHQIIYLLKFLEFIEDYYPNKLSNSFADDVFVYANVPYKIKSYADIVKNPKDTIDFDHKLDAQIHKERAILGADASLIKNQKQAIHKVNMMEKLLATMLAKVSNFIPEGGIWLNTQRPEWNDANNALVGNGVSMVTLYYLKRFTTFFEEVVSKSNQTVFSVSSEFFTFFDATLKALQANQSILSKTITNKDRKSVLDALGSAASEYRLKIYQQGFAGDKQTISKADIIAFTQLLHQYFNQTIDANKREDNMYHAYNLMTVENAQEVSISYLPEMLEGQVAALSAGYLSPVQALALLDGLKASALFRPDQYSYILYPDKDLPRFTVKNNIDANTVSNSKLLATLVNKGNTAIIEKDVNGVYHFNGNFNNASFLETALQNLPAEYQEAVKAEKDQILSIYESIFNHKAFTGRSGTFFGYEGLGSIYWHMVSKLLLAVQENCWMAVNTNQSDEIIGRLLEHYYEINEGIGVNKSPKLYGAFPTDPYSHTPATKGAQQPGMTGQVKEDILSRKGELGVFVTDGKLYFHPRLLRKTEFLNEQQSFFYVDVVKNEHTITLEPNSVAFTYCQIPVIYKLASTEGIDLHYANGAITHVEGLSLDVKTSNTIFNRTGEITKLEVSILIEKIA